MSRGVDPLPLSESLTIDRQLVARRARRGQAGPAFNLMRRESTRVKPARLLSPLHRDPAEASKM